MACSHLIENSKILLHPVTKFKRLSRDEFDLATKAVDNSGSVDIPVPTMSVWFLHQILQSGLVVKWAENEEKSGNLLILIYAKKLNLYSFWYYLKEDFT